jgi:ribosome-binding factor A
MKNQSSWASSATNLCVEFGEEDGIGPRYLVKDSRSKTSHKTLQLCKEASRIVTLVLTGETQHPLLRDLHVLSVAPEHEGQSPCVTVAHYACDLQVSDNEILAALKRVQGLMRCALAQALNRKHTPVLRFRYVSPINPFGKGGG